MMIPISYNVRSVLTRWRNTGATMLSIALAVAVIICVFALQGGIERSLTTAGTPGNVLILRDGATAELNSTVTMANYDVLAFLPGIAKDPATGRPLISAEVLAIQAIPRGDGGPEINVSIRGLGEFGPALRPMVRLVDGRWYRPGMREAVLSQRLAQRFGTALGETIQLGRSKYDIVGITDAAQTAFDSEIWTSVTDLREDFNVDFYGIAVARLEANMPPRQMSAEFLEKEKERLRWLDRTPYRAAGEIILREITTDQRLNHVFQTEDQYFASQTKSAAPIKVLGTLLALLLGPGAALTAMNAMYASIAGRTKEVGTLRVLGYGRFSILAGFMIESIVLALLGGALGCGMSYALIQLATSMDLSNFGTMNFTTFTELVFQFSIERDYLMGGMMFAFCIGLFGGFLPAFAAARLPVLVALRST